MIEIIKENIWIYFLVINLMAYIAFWFDKKLSQTSTQRIPEASLLLLCLLGGTIGGYIASQKFRHKTKKGPFRAKFYMVVFVQIIALVVIVADLFFGIKL